MVGNDIVDLADPETRLGACHPRFDRRVFAPAELELLATTRSHVRMRWILWSAKEAAYKAARQACATTVFSPSRFVVRLNPALQGSVRHGSRCWNVRIQLNGNCVHAVVSDEKFSEMDTPAKASQCAKLEFQPTSNWSVQNEQ